MSALSEFYDFYDGPEDRKDQLDFYASLFDQQKSELLELACGTGIITLELARRGFYITGIDYDDDMLNIAKRKASLENADVQKRVQFLLGNMKDFVIGKIYDAIIIPTNSFGYLFKFEDQISCLQHVSNHLPPHGILVIEERYRSPERLTQMINLRGVERTWEGRINPQTGKYTMYKDCIRWIDFASQTIYRTAWIDEVQEDGSIKRYTSDSGYFGSRNHYFTKIELQLLIERCGFNIKDVWGDLTKQPFNSQSNSIIIFAEKAA